MSFGRLGSQLISMELNGSVTQSPGAGPHFSPELLASVGLTEDAERLGNAIVRTRDWLISQQYPDGFWVGELEGDTILESEYILLLTWPRSRRFEDVQRAAKYIENLQLEKAAAGRSIPADCWRFRRPSKYCTEDRGALATKSRWCGLAKRFWPRAVPRR